MCGQQHYNIDGFCGKKDRRTRSTFVSRVVPTATVELGCVQEFLRFIGRYTCGNEEKLRYVFKTRAEFDVLNFAAVSGAAGVAWVSASACDQRILDWE